MASQQVRSIAQNRRRSDLVPSYLTNPSERPRMSTSTRSRHVRQTAHRTPDELGSRRYSRAGGVDSSSALVETERDKAMGGDESEVHEPSSATNSDTDGSDYDPGSSTSSDLDLDSEDASSDSEAQEVEQILVSSASSTPTPLTPALPALEPLEIIDVDVEMGSPLPGPKSARASSESSTGTNSDVGTHVSEMPAVGTSELGSVWEGSTGRVDEVLELASFEVEGNLAYMENSGPFWFVEPPAALLDDGLSVAAESEDSLAARYGSWMSQSTEMDFEQYLGDKSIEQNGQGSMPVDDSVSLVFQTMMGISTAFQMPGGNIETESRENLSAIHPLPSLEGGLSERCTPSPRSPLLCSTDEDERNPMSMIIAIKLVVPHGCGFVFRLILLFRFAKDEILLELSKTPEDVLSKIRLSQFPPDPNKRIQAFVEQMGVWIDQASFHLPLAMSPVRKKEAYSWQDAKVFGSDFKGPREGAQISNSDMSSKVLEWHPDLRNGQEKAAYLQAKVEWLEERLRTLRTRSSRLATIKSTALNAPQSPFLDKPFPKAGLSRVKGISLDPRFKATLLSQLESDGKEQDCLIRLLRDNVERAWRADEDRRDVGRMEGNGPLQLGQELGVLGKHWSKSTEAMVQRVRETHQYFDQLQAELGFLLFVALRRSQT
ncbi:hypothetical protein BKA70DRAFT_1257196 [Coprinopsis sp. MPI-PUGE-AT-0042]|nr:hypothetical protein BKA70DRAFT_1257196 [Coprinopsis sp. MPI-PUGE-AT-0042]